MTEVATVRTLQLRRIVDVSGVSGIGVVAYGVEFPDGTVVLRWDTVVRSTVYYDSIGDVEKITGHGGNTIIEWLDQARLHNAVVEERNSMEGEQQGSGTESFEQGAQQSASAPGTDGDTNVDVDTQGGDASVDASGGDAAAEASGEDAPQEAEQPQDSGDGDGSSSR